jgi:hypothetical protein
MKQLRAQIDEALLIQVLAAARERGCSLDEIVAEAIALFLQDASLAARVESLEEQMNRVTQLVAAMQPEPEALSRRYLSLINKYWPDAPK